mmetsp:Transcript_88852/g.172066  ORF Transcript_88852/g.172066 Transcript_88852/m.172066 type:complete len:213 (+) Transcript_88852:423-1061(+)|eukprot:CAMPEP_0171605696 /NCGR_PEP_ID=MMETSP0990-20121206/7341_1 /TAXON_ID=483369 /ORGANISM="non described non described, Strain CCMP2098" /LENGTH=212 /DNA_ID=CAMNT_0012168431 /DNA_START=278 /DNA_END=916 /DNA_ORIENTATION=-
MSLATPRGFRDGNAVQKIHEHEKGRGKDEDGDISCKCSKAKPVTVDVDDLSVVRSEAGEGGAVSADEDRQCGRLVERIRRLLTESEGINATKLAANINALVCCARCDPEGPLCGLEKLESKLVTKLATEVVAGPLLSGDKRCKSHEALIHANFMVRPRSRNSQNSKYRRVARGSVVAFQMAAEGPLIDAAKFPDSDCSDVDESEAGKGMILV